MRKFPTTKKSNIVKPHSDEFVAIGRVIKPLGLRGELKVKQISDFSERFQKLSTVHLELNSGEVRSFETEKTRINGHIVVIKLKGINDRNTADTLKGAYVSVHISEIFPPGEGSFYIFELEGMKVFNSDGIRIGHVKKVEKYPANDILIVETEKKDIMIPAIKEFVKEINVEKKLMVIEVPEGLNGYPRGSV